MILLWLGVKKVIAYYIAMYYSQTAPAALDDDKAYAILQTQGTVSSIIFWISAFLVIMFIYFIIKQWIPKEIENTTEK